MGTQPAPDGAPPNLFTVAAMAGVSKSTVSRVITGSPHVTKESAEAVRAAIAKLNYVPNRAARSLVQRKTHMIAMVIPERTAEFFADPYFAEVIQGAALHASSTGYTLTLLIESEVNPEQSRQFLTGGNVDGALVLSHHTGTQSYAEVSPTLPIVFGVRPLQPTSPAVHVVDVDNVEVGYRATQVLIESGRRRIGTIAGPLDTAAGIDRLEGFHRAVAEAGIASDLVEQGDFTPPSGAAAMHRLLKRDPTLDAVFAASAQMGSGALTYLRERGIPVPQAVAVTSADDNFFAASESLTTMDLHTAEKGAVMVETLLALVQGREVPLITTIHSDLVKRSSA